MAATQPRKIPLATLQEAARLATRTALEPFERIPEDVELTLGTFWEEDEVVFKLYIAKDRPKDAVVLTEARVNSMTGMCGPSACLSNGERGGEAEGTDLNRAKSSPRV